MCTLNLRTGDLDCEGHEFFKAWLDDHRRVQKLLWEVKKSAERVGDAYEGNDNISIEYHMAELNLALRKLDGTHVDHEEVDGRR